MRAAFTSACSGSTVVGVDGVAGVADVGLASKA